MKNPAKYLLLSLATIGLLANSLPALAESQEDNIDLIPVEGDLASVYDENLAMVEGQASPEAFEDAENMMALAKRHAPVRRGVRRAAPRRAARPVRRPAPAYYAPSYSPPEPKKEEARYGNYPGRGGHASTYGDTTYYSNGGHASTYGDTTYFSNGGHCSTYSGTQYCS
jgi:hypothetical protein